MGDTAWKIFLSRNPGLDPRWLSHILNVEPHQPFTLLEAIATHPAANETVWLELVEKKGAPLVGSILIGHDKALKSKKIRDLLREVDRSGAYALKVLEEAEDEQERLETFRCLVARNPEKAARALASENIPENVELTAKDMAPLLQSAQGHVRMTAICALEKLRISIEDSGIRKTDEPSHTDTRTMS